MSKRVDWANLARSAGRLAMFSLFAGAGQAVYAGPDADKVVPRATQQKYEGAKAAVEASRMAMVKPRPGACQPLVKIAGKPTYMHKAVAVGRGALVVAGGGGRISTSLDGGATWSSNTCGNQDLRDVKWTGAQFVAVGDMGVELTSGDGLQWSLALPNQNIYLRHLAVGPNNTMVAISDLGLVVRKGGEWQAVSTSDMKAVEWLGDRFLAVGAKGQVLAGSADGMMWKEVRAAEKKGRSLNALASGKGRVVIGGFGAQIYMSEGGGKWEDQALDDRQVIEAFAYSPTLDRFVVGTNLGNMFSSDAGKDWKKRDSHTIEPIQDIAWTGNQFFAVGGFGLLMSSPDGLKWTVVNEPVYPDRR